FLRSLSNSYQCNAGRPDGKPSSKYSLKPVELGTSLAPTCLFVCIQIGEHLSKVLGQAVLQTSECVGSEVTSTVSSMKVNCGLFAESYTLVLRMGMSCY